MDKIEMGKGVLIPTYKCNQRCKCCYAMADILTANGEMSLEEAKKAIDFFDMLGIKTYTLLGGEPLIYKDINEIIRYAMSKNITSWVVTNGMMLADNRFGEELVKSGVIGGCISLFSLEKAIHESVTNIPGSYNKVISALTNTINYNWPFFPMLTLLKNNIDNIINDSVYLARMGFKKIYINYGIPNVVSEYDKNLDSNPIVLAKLTEKLFEFQEKIGVKFIFNCEKNKIPLCFFDDDKFETMKGEKQIGTGCEFIKGNTIVIEPGGNVLGCSHWVKHPLMNIYKNYNDLETISEKEFWNVWMNGFPSEVRKSYASYPFNTCVDCKRRVLKECYGGCKAWHNSGALENKIKIY